LRRQTIDDDGLMRFWVSEWLLGISICFFFFFFFFTSIITAPSLEEEFWGWRFEDLEEKGELEEKREKGGVQARNCSHGKRRGILKSYHFVFFVFSISVPLSTMSFAVLVLRGEGAL
jgi:hypothetical protein